MFNKSREVYGFYECRVLLDREINAALRLLVCPIAILARRVTVLRENRIEIITSVGAMSASRRGSLLYELLVGVSVPNSPTISGVERERLMVGLLVEDCLRCILRVIRISSRVVQPCIMINNIVWTELQKQRSCVHNMVFKYTMFKTITISPYMPIM